MNRYSNLRCATILPLVLMASCSDQPNHEHHTTGHYLQAVLAEKLQGHDDSKVNANCPNKRLLKGESITCTAIFESDDSYIDLVVTIKSFDENGNLERLEIDIKK